MNESSRRKQNSDAYQRYSGDNRGMVVSLPPAPVCMCMIVLISWSRNYSCWEKSRQQLVLYQRLRTWTHSGKMQIL